MSLSRAQIFQIATLEAGRILQRNKTNFEEPVNVFSIVEADNIVLNFQELGNLAGAYLPSEVTGAIPGILVNENLPVTRQRYTVAHEYCHHLRKDPVSFDTSEQLFLEAYKRDERERIAETFASCLLMPRPLIVKSLQKMGISIQNSRNQIGPMQAYSLSLRLGTSYIATIGRLLALQLISDSQYKKLSSLSPRDMKAELGKESLESSWNDIWMLSQLDHGSIIYPRQGDTIRLSLKENPTTGFKWKVSFESEHLELLNSEWFASGNPKIGNGGERLFEFKVGEPGEMLLELQNCRPWELETVVDNFQVKLLIQSKRHGISPQWLLAG